MLTQWRQVEIRAEEAGQLYVVSIARAVRWGASIGARGGELARRNCPGHRQNRLVTLMADH